MELVELDSIKVDLAIFMKDGIGYKEVRSGMFL